MEIDGFIEQTSKAETLDALVEIYKTHIRSLGFERYVCSLITDSFPERMKYPALMGDYPDCWIQHYRTHNYIDHDPIFERGKVTRGLFEWNDEDDKARPALQRKIAGERRDAGIKGGYSLFIHGPGGSLSTMTVANASDDISRDKKLLSSLCLSMYQFHLCSAHFLADLYRPVTQVVLSPRECEVLLWCAKGKSNYAIASILGISEKTIEYYFNSLFRKLNVDNRTAAVLKAISLRLIAP